MLGDLYPGVEPAFRQGRKGNPLEQAIAVSGGELTEEEIFNLLDNAGVTKEYEELPETVKSLVRTGLFGLWRVDRLGRHIEENDKAILGKAKEMADLVEENSERIERDYHAITSEWLPISVDSLIKTASEENPLKRRSYENGVIIPPDDYIRKLRNVGYEYSENTHNILNDNKRNEINFYLNDDRESNLSSARKIVNTDLGEVLSEIGSAHEKST
jgi:hypothetical protein